LEVVDGKDPDDVLVEEVADGLCHSPVRPAAMDEDEALQEPELADGVVGRHGRLATLDARNADTDVGLLDHGHVVGAVTD